MASATSKLTIQIVADAAKAKAGFKDADKASGGFGKTIGKLGSTLSGALPVAGAVAGAALGAAAAFVEFGQEAAEDARQAGRLRDSLKRLPGVTDAVVDSTEDFIGAMEMATHVGDDKLRTALGRIAQTTGDVSKAQDYVTLALDAAAGSGREFETVAEAMRKAAGGNTGALKKLFPELDANKDGTLELSEATKGLGERYKDAAKAAADRDPFAKISVIWGNMKEALGQFVLPLLEKLGDWFKNPANQNKIREYIDKVARFSREVGEKAAKAIQQFVDWLKRPETQQKLKEFGQLVSDVATFAADVVSKIGGIKSVLKTTFNLTGLGLVLNTANALKWAFQKAYEFWQKLRGIDPNKHVPSGNYTPVPGYGSGGYNPSLGPRPKSAGTVINVQGALDPVGVARQVARLITTDQARSGNPAGYAWAAY